MRSRLGTVDRESRYVVVGLILWTLFHAYWMLTENVNWDEFALLARARESVLSGVLHTGGRPGLGTLALVPFVRECGDVIAAVRWARFAWTGFGLSILIAFWILLRKVLPGRDKSDVSDRLLGLSLLGLTPAFLRYSIQVRTDQPAVALGLFGSVALVTSRNRSILALLAGVLFGTGFLFSQKLAYVAALGGLLAIGDTLRYGRPDLRRDLGRVGLTLAGAIGTLVVYHMIMAATFGDVPPPVSRGYLGAFEFYRMSDEYQYYRRMAPGLLPHTLLSLFVIAGFHRGPRPLLPSTASRVRLAAAVVALGIVVGGFHAAATPYFWMTLGLYPAIALVLALPIARQAFRSERTQQASMATLWSLLLLIAGVTATDLSRDSQRVQRESLDFVDRNMSSEDIGFHPEKALLCRDDPSPMPTYFEQNIRRDFYVSSSRDKNRSEFIQEFTDRPISFILESYRLSEFPEEIRVFWETHYVRYGETVFVAGQHMDLQGYESLQFPVIVSGDYRWTPDGHSGGTSIRVSSTELAPGGVVQLAAGEHTITAAERPVSGILALRMSDPPAGDSASFFKRFGNWE